MGKRYGAQEISRGAGGVGWLKAHRTAARSGEFDDECDHGNRLPLCPNIDCIRDYEQIVISYLHLMNSERRTVNG